MDSTPSSAGRVITRTLTVMIALNALTFSLQAMGVGHLPSLEGFSSNFLMLIATLGAALSGAMWGIGDSK